LRLTAELAQALTPLAFAGELQPNGSLLVPQGLGAAVLAARAILEESPDVNWFALEQRLSVARHLAQTPQLEAGSLRDYQREGASWMLHLAEWAPGCVLADDMGLGKTVQTAAILLARAKLGPSIVVAPASVTFNWAAELARFAPSLNVRNLYQEPELDWAALQAGEVVVASYGMLMRVQHAHTTAFATTVLDEAQYLKNRLTKRAIAIAKLQRGFTIALSGTPIENHLGELWSIFSLVFPGLLGSAKAFHLRFRENIEGVPDSPALDALRELLRPFLLRRTRADVLAELPAREDFTEFIQLGSDERTRYETLRKACELEFLREDKRLSVAQKRIQIFAAITNLRQLACHPGLVDPSYVGGSQKLERLVELCTSATSRGASVLVFSQFTKLLKRALAALKSAELSTGYLDGATSIPARKNLVESFQSGEFQVFCISLMAGGTGLNLTRASYVVHLDPWWNPAVEEQATSRAHRMGQANRVTTYRLVAKDTIEESILALQDDKRSLVTQVLEGHGEATTLGVSELVALLRPPPDW
jgi:SNF2 family DNA or RNA helicase